MIKQLPALKQKLIKLNYSTEDLSYSNLGFLKDGTLVLIDFSDRSFEKRF